MIVEKTGIQLKLRWTSCWCHIHNMDERIGPHLLISELRWELQGCITWSLTMPWESQVFALMKWDKSADRINDTMQLLCWLARINEPEQPATRCWSFNYEHWYTDAVQRKCQKAFKTDGFLSFCYCMGNCKKSKYSYFYFLPIKAESLADTVSQL